MLIRQALIALLPLLAFQYARGAVFKCELTDGSTQYQATPCTAGKGRPLAVQVAVPLNSVATSNTNPEIIGSEAFRNQVVAALLLLRSRDAYGYSIVTAYVGRIREAAKSGMRAYDTPPTFEMSALAASQSVTWVAAAIAHDSYHSKLYHDYKDSNAGRPVPDDIWGGTLAEQRCMNHQLTVMRGIGAPQREIDHASAQMHDYYMNDRTISPSESYKRRTW